MKFLQLTTYNLQEGHTHLAWAGSVNEMRGIAKSYAASRSDDLDVHEVDIDTSKEGILNLLHENEPLIIESRLKYHVTERGALKPVERVPA